MKLTTAAKEKHELTAQLAAHVKSAKHEETRLLDEIRQRTEVLLFAEAALDTDKIALAETVIFVGNYAAGGSDRASCIHDAIQQLSTGKPIGAYANLWNDFFGTKNYDRWSGQRSDHPYGYSPRHGSTCFSLGLCEAVRQRNPRVITPEETEAAIYYLLNVERIQKAKQLAATPVMA